MNGILASSGAGGAAGLGSIFIMYAVVIGVFWFFLMRPQKKEQKKKAAMLSALEETGRGFRGCLPPWRSEIRF